MKNINFAIIIFAAIIFNQCKPKDKRSDSMENSPQVVFSVTAASDTIKIGEYAKVFAKLKKPYFSDKESEIMVIMESNDSFPLKPDLSNEYDIDLAVFLNLYHDTINQKWVRNVDNKKTAVFGGKFTRTGKDTIRGYIMEYLGNVPPIDDAALDTTPAKKYYFEEEVFVVPTKE